MLSEKYFNKLDQIVKNIRNTQMENIKKSGKIIADAIEDGGKVYVFGSAHTGMIAMELFYRAGGLMLVNPILPEGLNMSVKPITKTTHLERLEGYGQTIMEDVNLTEKDVLMVASVSGRNATPIEVALEGKKRGASLIVLTSLNYTESVSSRHSSGKRLFEVDPDVILDNCGVKGDATIKVEGLEQKVGPTSTIAGCYIVNAVIIESIAELLARGIEPPIFTSANLDGGEEKNARLMEEYSAQIEYM